MKKINLLLAVFIFGNSFAQLKKIELTNDEIQFIAKNQVGLSEPSEKMMKEHNQLDKTIFIFEISNNSSILYRNSLRNWNPINLIHQESGRTKLALCFNYNDLSQDVILELLEKNEWKLKKMGDSKFICNNDFPIIKFNKETNNYQSNDILKNKLVTKIYKIVD